MIATKKSLVIIISAPCQIYPSRVSIEKAARSAGDAYPSKLCCQNLPDFSQIKIAVQIIQPNTDIHTAMDICDPILIKEASLFGLTL